ncbi:MAG: DNA mismatch repair endonuclease MutL [Anaerolineae bacterium]|nr:DNA mismatch repair endonuclease MutL [Anaerolineae bacterium]
MPIRILPPEVAVKIAAGEVIERPASVAKELIENAIDAGAQEIHVEIAQGGRRLVKVSDDGCGIPADEVELAFARHATSKLQSVEDLYRVRTLGFRGEALASIAAVSRLTLTTRAADEKVGTLIRLEGGEIIHREPLGRPPGTMVLVENLFFNTPVRLKFLRSDTTEAGHVARLLSSYALAFPEKRFTLQNGSRLVLRTTGTGALYDAIVAIYGVDVAEQMFPIPRPEEDQPVKVWGYIGAPSLHRSNRLEIIFFVNRRWVQDNALSYAITEAYRTLIPQGRYPVAILNIELPPEQVDVNIHPTKREVRFRQKNLVFVSVQKAVRSTLMAKHSVPAVQVPRSPLAGWRPPARSTPSQAHMALELYRPGELPRLGDSQERLSTPPQTERLPMLRVLGQLAQTYIIAEGPGGMYLIDQHAAHERIRYEELKAQRERAEVASQELLEPLPIELSPRQATLLEAHLEDLALYGFEIIPFGGSTFLVKRVPAQLVGQAIAAAIMELLDAAIDGGKDFSWEEQTLITLACHTAIRAGQTLSLEEMRTLIQQLEKTSLPHTCPHGRPTMIHLSQAQLEKEFGRR